MVILDYSYFFHCFHIDGIFLSNLNQILHYFSLSVTYSYVHSVFLLLLYLIALENKSTITGGVRLADDVMIQLFRWQTSYKFDSAVIHTAVLCYWSLD